MFLRHALENVIVLSYVLQATLGNHFLTVFQNFGLFIIHCFVNQSFVSVATAGYLELQFTS